LSDKYNLFLQHNFKKYADEKVFVINDDRFVPGDSGSAGYSGDIPVDAGRMSPICHGQELQPAVIKTY